MPQSGEIPGFPGDIVPVHRGVQLSVRSSLGTKHRRVRSRPRRAPAISVLVAVMTFRHCGTRGFANYLQVLPRSRRSSCCRSISSSANSRHRSPRAMRLFGNIMSGTLIVAILLTITPLIFPIFMDLLGLLTGMVQGVHFQHPRRRLHRGRHAHPRSLNHDHQQRKDTHGQHDHHRNRVDHHRWRHRSDWGASRLRSAKAGRSRRP